MKKSQYNLEIIHSNDRQVIFNTRTGLLLRVPAQTYRQLEEFEPGSDQTIPSMPAFVRRGFAVPASMDESAQFFSQYLRFQEAEAQILSFTIALTTACNYRCFYCFEEGVQPRSMHATDAERLCDFIEKAASQATACRAIHIKWFGGEPLLAPNILRQIGERIQAYCGAHHLEFSTRIITNASLLTADHLDMLCRFNLTDIQISMDGRCDEYCLCKGAAAEDYHHVIDLIQNQCRRVHFILRLNCLPENYASILALVDALYIHEDVRKHVSIYLANVETDAAKSFSAREFADIHLDFLQHLFDLGWYSQIQNIMPAMHTTPCYNHQKGNYTIGPDGLLYICEADIGDAEKSIGCICENPQEIEQKKQALNHAFNLTFDSQCLNCSYFPICFSGCPRKRRDAEACSAFRRETRGILKLISQIPG